MLPVHDDRVYIEIIQKVLKVPYYMCLISAAYQGRFACCIWYTLYAIAYCHLKVYTPIQVQKVIQRRWINAIG